MKLLLLSASFFALSLALTVVTQDTERPVVSVQKQTEAHDLPTESPRPTISPTNIPPLTATSLYILDVKTSKPLFEKNADVLVAPASTTKMMTALIASASYNPDMVVTIPYFTVEGQKMNLFSGEKMTIESLLYGLLVYSANDSAEALARIYPGGRDAFIEAMNIHGRKIGLTSTVFRNPTGLDQSTHVSTAREMAMLGSAVMDNYSLREIVGTTKATVLSSDGKFVHNLATTNALLTSIPGVMGIKTGWTEEAHENLVTYIERDGHPIIIALFGSDDRFGETKALIEWVYGNTQW